LAIEEMLGVTIPEGALYYNTPRRMAVIELDSDLRVETEAVICRPQAVNPPIK
jgi:CRISPR/Cas system-associated exonuclease Cas4 (RecB family)